MLKLFTPSSQLRFAQRNDAKVGENELRADREGEKERTPWSDHPISRHKEKPVSSQRRRKPSLSDQKFLMRCHPGVPMMESAKTALASRLTRAIVVVARSRLIPRRDQAECLQGTTDQRNAEEHHEVSCRRCGAACAPR